MKKYTNLFSKRYLTSRLILLCVLASCFQNCAKDNGQCKPSSVVANITMTKVSNSCKDLFVAWPVSFALELQFEFDIQCGEHCTGNTIIINERQTIKNQDGVKNVSERGTFVSCDEKSRTGYLLNNMAENPQFPVYELGDTLVFEFFNLSLCAGKGFINCGSTAPLDVPDFTFEYVLMPADFECN